ncbi:MAG: hypothetical protein R3D25_15265 [Geminicoccaceae bacterium]|jgi:hypothetical protein
MAVVLVAALLLACTTSRPIDIGAGTDLGAKVKPEDYVEVTTIDGQALAFEVLQVEPDALVGKGVRVERDQIGTLEVTEPSVGRTAAAVGGTGLAVFLIVGFVVAAIAPALILSGAAP